MKTSAFKILVIVFAILFSGCEQPLEEHFINPPDEYKPMPFWHINVELTTEVIRQQMKDANAVGFSGVSDEPIKTEVFIRGRHKLQKWNSHNGNIDKNIQLEHLQIDGENYIRFALALEPVKSVFYMGKN